MGKMTAAKLKRLEARKKAREEKLAAQRASYRKKVIDKIAADPESEYALRIKKKRREANKRYREKLRLKKKRASVNKKYREKKKREADAARGLSGPAITAEANVDSDSDSEDEE